jgi:hypothetical protein
MVDDRPVGDLLQRLHSGTADRGTYPGDIPDDDDATRLHTGGTHNTSRYSRVFGEVSGHGGTLA